MSQFKYSFIVDASPAAVVDFHHDTTVLKRLVPPPILAQIHQFEPLADGSLSEFTLWFGPLPVRWVAIHSEVGPEGFVDTQQSGPLRRWRHAHRFLPTDDGRTRIEDQIEFEHHPGLRGIFSRLLFPPPFLWIMFSYRKLVIKRALEK